MIDVKIKRIYEPLGDADGYRVLVDRLWPRGVKKESADIDLWMKEVTPSTGLRTWFGHDPEKWAAFSRKYRAELQKEEASVKKLVALAKKHKTVTLLYAAKDQKHTHALVLQRYVNSQLKKS